MLGNLVLGLVSDLISTFIMVPVLSLVALWLLRTAPQQRVWGLRQSVDELVRARRPTPTTVISTSSFQDTGAYRRPQTGIGQVRAIAVLAPSVARAYRSPLEHQRVRMSTGCDLSDPIYSGDLLLIGGPKTNEVTREVLRRVAGRLPDGVSFDTEATATGAVDRIRWQGDPQESTPEVVHGLVLRCANPFGEDGILTMVAGSSTYGTEAAAIALVDSPRLRGRWRGGTRRRREGYVALVRAEVATHGRDVARLHRARVVDMASISWRAEVDDARH